MSTHSEEASIDATLALLRAAGVGRFAAAGEGTTPAAAKPSRPYRDDDAASDVRGLIRAAGIAGYDLAKMAADDAACVEPAPRLIAALTVPSFAQAAPGGHSERVAPPPATPSLSRRQFAVLDIAPGGELTLAALEAKMGVPFAADYRGQPYWSAAASAAGGTRRAFTFMAGQLVGFADLLGDLGSPALRLSVTGIDLANFKAAGPGAAARTVNSGPPQMPQGLPRALRSALEH